MRWRFPDDDRVDPELTRIGGRRGRGYVWFVAGFAVIAAIELYGYFFGLPTDPRVLMLFDAALVGGALLQIRRSRANAVAPFLSAAITDDAHLVERMLGRIQSSGTQVVSGIAGDGFELEHVVISDRALVIVQNMDPGRTGHKHSQVSFTEDQILRDGRTLPGDPVRQLRARVAWLTNLLQQLTGDQYPVRGALLFPGSRVDPMPAGLRRDIWLIEPRALAAFIEREPVRLATTEVMEAFNQLQRFARLRAMS